MVIRRIFRMFLFLKRIFNLLVTFGNLLYSINLSSYAQKPNLSEFPYYRMRNARKGPMCSLRATKALISLRIRAG